MELDKPYQLPVDQPRIVGTETEYGLICEKTDESRTILGIIDQNIPTAMQRHGQFMSNGARFYVDIGVHPEYSTPEAASFRECMIHEIAGERIVYDTFRRAKIAGDLASFQLNKRVTDKITKDSWQVRDPNLPPTARFWGSHENYLVTSAFSFERAVPPLAAHLATRSIWSGAGIVREGEFHIAQKMDSIYTLDKGEASSKHRPLVNIDRRRPYADEADWQRLHIACGDSNMMPWAIWMKLGTTSLLLRMIEQGVQLSDLYLRDAVIAARQVARDPKLTTRVKTERHERLTAAEIQHELAKRALQLAEAAPLPAEEVAVAREWEEVSRTLPVDTYAYGKKIDWIAKRHIVDSFRQKHQLPYSHEDVEARDVAWDNLNPKNGIAQLTREKGRLPIMPTEAEIQAAITTAPQTRASLRGAFVTALAQRPPKTSRMQRPSIFWEELAYLDAQKGETVRVGFGDPRQPTNEAFDETIATMQTVGKSVRLLA